MTILSGCFFGLLESGVESKRVDRFEVVLARSRGKPAEGAACAVRAGKNRLI
jgi:hypothetical protein